MHRGGRGADGVLATGGALARLWPLVSQEALPRWFRPFAEVERIATSIRSWEPLVIPGLLQTEDYARALITAWQPGDSREAVQQQVTARVERQQLLEREVSPLLWTIISELALRNPVGGPDVLRDQLSRLLDCEAEHPKVIVQVVPLDAGAHPGLEGPLVLVARPANRTLLTWRCRAGVTWWKAATRWPTMVFCTTCCVPSLSRLIPRAR